MIILLVKRPIDLPVVYTTEDQAWDAIAAYIDSNADVDTRITSDDFEVVPV